MIRRLLGAGLTLLLLAACSADPAELGRRTTSVPSPVETAPSQPARPPGAAGSTPPGLPSPRQKVPSAPGVLAAELTRLHRELAADIDRWQARGGKLEERWARPIALKSLYVQRIYRKLGRNPGLAGAVIQRMRGRAARFAAANSEATRLLFTLVRPGKRIPNYMFRRPLPPARLRALYDLAERRFGIPWYVLAAVNYTESKFGRILGPSSAGALGPMQFLPSTWEQYGGGGDILDPRDSIMGAARYLQASGAPSDLKTALLRYNPSDAYVESILLHANAIRRDPDNFYVYYFWQAFFLTTRGDVQLTGAGARGPGAKTVW